MPKKKSITTLKTKAWNLCSLGTRLRYADDDGFVQCYTCGRKRHYKDGMQAGHGFSGRSKSVLFMEEIIRPQCSGCNIRESGKLDVFTYKLLKEHGQDKFDALYLEAHQDKGQWKAWELEELIDKWKKEI